MRPVTTSATARTGASSPTRRRRATLAALAAFGAVALLLAACGGSARSSMRPIIDGERDPSRGPLDTPTTARPTSVTGKIDTSSTSAAPARQGRTDPGGGGTGDTGTGAADLGAPPATTDPANGDGGGGGGAVDGGGASDAVTTTASTEPPAPEPTAAPTTTGLPPGAVAIKVRVTNLGTILVDGEDHTLYASITDVNNEGTCHGACTAQWVPIASNTVVPGSGVVTSLIGAITRADTIVQLTYGGHPLYRLANEPIGDVMGQGDAATWYVVDAATGNLVVR